MEELWSGGRREGGLEVGMSLAHLMGQEPPGSLAWGMGEQVQGQPWAFGGGSLGWLLPLASPALTPTAAMARQAMTVASGCFLTCCFKCSPFSSWAGGTTLDS